jgi:cysteine desulfurase family protein
MIYLDNAATSWPKPREVIEAMNRFLQFHGANPGRSGHKMSIEASRYVFSAREAVCQLVNGPDPLRVVFSHNITDALNLALFGLLRPGDHVVTSSMEHNSVMRPLNALQKQGVQYTVVPCSPEGFLPLDLLEEAIRPNTKLMVINHASNVIGTLQPLRGISEIAHKHNLILLVDSAQTAGAYPIDMKVDGIDVLAFTGHKALQGPTGTGGLILGERIKVEELSPIKFGGTGSHSESEQQPDFLPDKYESGTMNAIGLAGLDAGIRRIMRRGLMAVRAQEMELCDQMIKGLEAIQGIVVYGTQDTAYRTATVGFNDLKLQPSDVVLQLDQNYEIMARGGLHCAPAAHRTIGTFPVGCVRFSLGFFTTRQDVEAALKAVKALKRS